MGIKILISDPYDFQQKLNYSGNESWRMNGPTIITKDDLILLITLHHSSFVYAT